MRPGCTGSPNTAIVGPAHWSTVETDEIATQLRESPTPTLVDDLGVWLTGTLDRHDGWDGAGAPVAVRDEIEDMLAAVGAFASVLVLVSPEVGSTVVPATSLRPAVRRRIGHPQPEDGGGVRPGGAGGGRPGCSDQADWNLMEFAPVQAARCGRRRSRPRPPGHPDQAARRAGPPRGPIGLGVLVSGPVPAAAVRARPGGRVRR